MNLKEFWKIFISFTKEYSFSRIKSVSEIIEENCCNQKSLNGTLAAKKNESSDWKKLTEEERRNAVIIKTIKNSYPRESINSSAD